jgi:RNA polymerase sigma-70 factor (ECF subfamily)
MDSEDAACLGRIARKDQAALEELYARYYQRLFQYVWYLVAGDAPLVEEILQDTFLAVWNAANSFRGEARVATWMFRIAQRNVARSQRNVAHQAQRQTLSLSQLQDDLDPSAYGGQEDQMLTKLVVQAAMQRLSDRQREVVMLVLVHGFTGEEAAHILDVPPGTIRSRLRAARTLLLNDPALQRLEEVNP